MSHPVEDARRHAPATVRNRGPIGELLLPLLPASGLVLEVASGSGEHVVHFAKAAPRLTWQPSDASRQARASIAAWIAAEGVTNVRAPLALDAAGEDWPLARADAVMCVNMLHISPFASTEGLMRGAGRLLPPGGMLFVYGPFRRAGVETAPSNAAFDRALRAQDPRWGLRDLKAVEAVAAARGLMLETVAVLPANNLGLVFRKAAQG